MGREDVQSPAHQNLTIQFYDWQCGATPADIDGIEDEARAADLLGLVAQTLACAGAGHARARVMGATRHTPYLLTGGMALPGTPGNRPVVLMVPPHLRNDIRFALIHEEEQEVAKALHDGPHRYTPQMYQRLSLDASKPLTGDDILITDQTLAELQDITAATDKKYPPPRIIIDGPGTILKALSTRPRWAEAAHA
jgi:hypothetical protein